MFSAQTVLAGENIGSTTESNAGATTIQINHKSQEPPQRGAASAAGSVNNVANEAKDKNSSGAVVSYVVGGAMFAASAVALGYKRYELSATLGIMGAMAMMQGANNSNSASQAEGTAYKTASGIGFSGNANVGKDPLEDPLVKSLIDVEKAKEGMAQAKKMGIDGKNPVKINGKEYKPSDFSSRESMLAAGLSKDMVNSALAIAAKAEKAALAKLAALTPAQGFEEGTGSTTTAKAAGYNANVAATNYGGGQLRNVAAVNAAGLTKNFNGEPIGVAADSIFAMMTRRYKLKEKQNSFIDELGVNLQK